LAAVAADEDEAPLPPPEDDDIDEPDWHNTDTNTDPDYEPFDGEQVLSNELFVICYMFAAVVLAVCLPSWRAL
jgi:hypothetical protein